MSRVPTKAVGRRGVDPRLRRVLREMGGVHLTGEHDFASLSPEAKLRATASLARFMHEQRGRAAPPIAPRG